MSSQPWGAWYERHGHAPSQEEWDGSPDVILCARTIARRWGWRKVVRVALARRERRAGQEGLVWSDAAMIAALIQFHEPAAPGQPDRVGSWPRRSTHRGGPTCGGSDHGERPSTLRTRTASAGWTARGEKASRRSRPEQDHRGDAEEQHGPASGRPISDGPARRAVIRPRYTGLHSSLYVALLLSCVR